MEMNNKDNIKYLQAKKRVKQIKGFYIHLTVYVLVNLFLIAAKFFKNEEYESGNFWGMGMWGVGLAIHGLSVFLPGFLFGNDWEERKIREIMDKNRR